MIVVWRLTPPAFARLLDGEGSRAVGGRWNSPGRPVVYASSHLSLCVLEVYVHVARELRDALPAFQAVCIGVPDGAGITEVSIDQFKGLMADADPLAACQAVGDEWLARGSDLILSAPSVVVPEDSNIMLNPEHPKMREVGIVSMRRFRWDLRLV